MTDHPKSDEWRRMYAALEANNGNVRAASRETGIPRTTIQTRLISDRAQKKAPDGDPIDGFTVKGVSTLYNSDGEIAATWVKTEVDKERQETILRETIAALSESIKPAAAAPKPRIVEDDILTSYNIGDAHLGMFAWGQECGEDYDTTIAKQDLTASADRLIASSPSSRECLILQLGDFFHMDSTTNATPASGNRLDVDTRFARVIRIGIHTMRHLIDRALTKHQLVRVRNVAGNHDPHASIVLTEALRGYYAKEKRVIIEDSPKDFWTYRFGNVLIGVTHGHTVKPEKMAGLLAVDAQADWGQCTYRYVYHGHFHTKRAFEDLGVIVEGFRTLAARDAWTASMGYRNGRELQSIVLHKEFGEIERHTAGIRMVRG